MAVGATSPDPKRASANAWLMGKALAEEMRAVGLNVNFAPDLDVNNNPANPVIGIRSFSSDPQRVAAIGLGLIDGLQGAGVLAFGKHFPGHGDTGVDSHAELPVIGHTRARLDTVEFVPFKTAIAGGVAGIMSAHISFPIIDPTPGVPATLSTRVLTDLLRRDLGFEGLIVTDSLEMGALSKNGFPTPKAAARALASGADLLLFNSGFALHRAAIEQIVADVKSGAIPTSRLDDAVRRTLLAKARYGILKPAPVDAAAAATLAGSPAHQELAAKLAASAITLVRDEEAYLPLARGAAPVVIGPPAAGRLTELLQGTDLRISEQPTAAEAEAALRAIRAQPGTPVVLVLSGGHRAQADFARRVVATGAPVIVVALREPYDLLFAASLPARDKPPALVATYGVNPATLQALAALLKGDAKPSGHLPVELPGLYPIGTGLEDFVQR